MIINHDASNTDTDDKRACSSPLPVVEVEKCQDSEELSEHASSKMPTSHFAKAIENKRSGILEAQEEDADQQMEHSETLKASVLHHLIPVESKPEIINLTAMSSHQSNQHLTGG